MPVLDAKGYALQVNDKVILHATVTDITIAEHATSAEFTIEPKAALDVDPAVTCIATRSEKTSVSA